MTSAIAALLYPDLPASPSGLLAQYPPRPLPPGAIVTRFAPSPTGFIHIGSIYIAQIGRLLASQSDGVFILRIEDTDQQRKLEGGIDEIVSSLEQFGIVPDEGPCRAGSTEQRGVYGPYQQSQRRLMYHAFAQQLVATGLAYPSFQSSEDLAAIAERQKAAKVRPGYYGEWAADRTLTPEQIEAKLAAGLPFVIRIRAPYPSQGRVRVEDAIRGPLDLPANDVDYVLLKSDGLPTYHFAHVVDETLMRVNLVLRADEWLPTLPLHVQLFEAIGQPLPRFAHIAPIGRQEGGSKRKLSKRRDPEAAVSYYHEAGYPVEAIREYLLHVANAAFEPWRAEHPAEPLEAFPLRLNQMSVSIALFDLAKLDAISKDQIAALSAVQVYDAALLWADRFDAPMAAILRAEPEYAVQVFDVERGGEAPRKDLAHWSDIHRAYGFFFDLLFDQSLAEGYRWPALRPEAIRAALQAVLTLPVPTDKDSWVAQLRAASAASGFAATRQEFRSAPDQFHGQFADFMMILRVALANQQQTPDLFEMTRVLGAERVLRRLARALPSSE